MEKIWLKSYPSGIPETVNVETYHSLQEALEDYCKRFKDKTAFINFGISTSYSQLDKLSRDFAAYLQQHLKMKKGERFGIILPNVLQFPVAMFGAPSCWVGRCNF
ncbi:AMP-binding protein [Coxiella burnetii]|uniref:AMP-binding protein n=1 Tax=Coxiella burnetii TaxID=777 RepID=UPI00051F18C3|nr:AMP-binding protein [Coxiella burnetii]AIT62908.1 Long-chain-fatty-acid--CoA ligase [Coxiella burnetii str. Namibia]